MLLKIGSEGTFVAEETVSAEIDFVNIYIPSAEA